MKDTITLKIKTKGVETFDMESAKGWLEDLVHFMVKSKYAKRDLSEELDKCVGGDLFWNMTMEEWQKYRGYITFKEAINLNAKMLKALGPIEEMNLARTCVFLKTEVDFLGRHHLRFTLQYVDKHSHEESVEFGVNLHAVNHLANLTLLQLLRSFDYHVQIA